MLDALPTALIATTLVPLPEAGINLRASPSYQF
jgi:hypothetical protein